MKVGDLVSLQSNHRTPRRGLIIEEYPVTCGAAKYTEVRVRWLAEDGKGVSWVMRKDLEVISASR